MGERRQECTWHKCGHFTASLTVHSSWAVGCHRPKLNLPDPRACTGLKNACQIEELDEAADTVCLRDTHKLQRGSQRKGSRRLSETSCFPYVIIQSSINLTKETLLCHFTSKIKIFAESCQLVTQEGFKPSSP